MHTKKEHHSIGAIDEDLISSSSSPPCTSIPMSKKSSFIKKNRNSKRARRRYVALTTTAVTISIATITATAAAFIPQHYGAVSPSFISATGSARSIHTPLHKNAISSSYPYSNFASYRNSPSQTVIRNNNTPPSYNDIVKTCTKLNMSPSQYLEYKKTSSQIRSSSSSPPQSSPPSPSRSTSSASSPKNRINFYDLEELVAPKPTYKINPEADPSTSASSYIMKKKIVHLLSDDDGEEDECIPDYSEEAANEIADKLTYSRISEEAKLKANYAVQKIQKNTEGTKMKKKDSRSTKNHQQHESNKNEESFLLFDENEEDEIDEQQVVELKKKRKFTASVKETGVDTMSQYVKSMGSHELLPKESEVLLGKQIQILVQWENVRQELEEQLTSPPTFAQWSEKLEITVPELKKQIRRSQRAKAALIEANLRLVVTVARQTVKKGRSEINFQDACQEGIIGLSKACEKFDPEKGFRFSTYAIWWIKREVRKNLLEQSRSVRLPASAIKKINDIRINERLLITTLGRKPTDEEVAQKCNLTVEKVLFYRRKALDATSLDKQLVGKGGKGSSASGIESNGKTIGSLVKDLSPTPSEIANKEMLQNDVRRLIKTLSPREQAVIRLRFGLDDGVPRTLDYISKKFGVDKEKIRKIEAKALLKLRQPYRNQSVKCYISDL